MHDEVADDNDIVGTVRALEAANEPLRPREWSALGDPLLREQVAQRLQGLGRQLLTVTDETTSTVEGYLSGWSDEVAEELAHEPNDLQVKDLSLLALLYLRSEILERILGEEVLPVGEQLDAHEGSTGRDVIRGEDRQESIARLKAHQLITPQGKPGPALRRLTPIQRQRLDENLVLLLRPDSIWARSIRAARQARDSSEEEP